jgi:hypothetical protein
VKSAIETVGKVVERHELFRMTRGTECKCSSMVVNGLMKVRQTTSLLKSDPETVGKVVERCRSIRMTRGTECKSSSIEVNGLI